MKPHDSDVLTVRPGAAVTYHETGGVELKLAQPPVLIEPIMIPCRACKAAPGTACMDYSNEEGRLTHHTTRETDARFTSDLVRERAVRPSVLKRKGPL